MPNHKYSPFSRLDGEGIYTTVPALVLVKWMVLVFLSSIASLLSASLILGEAVNLFAMLCGMMTFALLYALLERVLIRLDKFVLRKQLLLAVLVKMLLQGFYQIEFFVGFFAYEIISYCFPELSGGFLHHYLLTLLVGAQLSIIVMLIVLMLKAIRALFTTIYQRKKSANRHH